MADIQDVSTGLRVLCKYLMEEDDAAFYAEGGAIYADGPPPDEFAAEDLEILDRCGWKHVGIEYPGGWMFDAS